MNSNTTKLLYEALEAKYIAQQKDALARLHVYATAAVGIGEHPQITHEMDELIGQLADANDRLSTLYGHVNPANVSTLNKNSNNINHE